MNYSMAYHKDWAALLLILCSAIISIGLLSACAGSGGESVDTRAAAANQASRLSNTNTPYVGTTNTVNGKDDFNTRVAQHMVAIATEAALSPHPTPPQGPVYLESPIPSPTWAVGIFYGQIPENTTNPAYVNCWAGYLDSNLLELCAGHEQRGGNPQQGVILVRVWEPDQVTKVSEGVYETPGANGPMHIIVADSNSVTVASGDSRAIYTFDIATRQWVPNPPSVLPTASP
jgi:hypothetical protein